MRRTDLGSPARLPDATGAVERDGVRVHWDAYGSEGPPLLLMPTWAIIHSRHWKFQIAHLARRHRVVVYDARGNGLSHRPLDVAAYRDREIVAAAVDVLDALGIAQAVALGNSCGGRRALQLAAWEPERVTGVVAIAPTLPQLAPELPERTEYPFYDAIPETDGWALHNRHVWYRDWRAYLEFFGSKLFSEPHSTRQVEDFVAWGLDTDARTVMRTECDLGYRGRAGIEALCRAVRCPVLVLHGTDDRIVSVEQGRRCAELTGARFVELVGSGHGPFAREPVLVNRLVEEFVAELYPAPPTTSTWRRALTRPRRALVVSSPIGLGHARRDLALAAELRRRVPGVEIDWLAQPPLTQLLAAAGERVHPASRELASESDHIDGSAGEHALDVFTALRRMDDIMLANYMLFDDVVRETDYDVWIADEAWEVDHFLHENPERKRAAYVWLTDFVGYQPLAADDERQVALTADYNAEMVEHVERFPWVRDLSLFVGEPADVAPGRFGPGLPEVRPWVESRYAFVGYEIGFGAVDAGADRAALRADLGWGPDETICVVAVGGSACGVHLLRRAVAAVPVVAPRVPLLRTVLVRGPRIPADAVPTANGVEQLGFVGDLPRLLAACDVAVVQGGLTTTMELVAANRPFVSVPLAQHFEQQIHVRHRLARHGATRTIDYAATGPEDLAAAIHDALATPPTYAPVARGGARRAAELIARLL